jgi:hypothetical protein
MRGTSVISSVLRKVSRLAWSSLVFYRHAVKEWKILFNDTHSIGCCRSRDLLPKKISSSASKSALDIIFMFKKYVYLAKERLNAEIQWVKIKILYFSPSKEKKECLILDIIHGRYRIFSEIYFSTHCMK